ncbi:secretion system protein F, partial [Micrococcus sp. SIMBA_131]
SPFGAGAAGVGRLFWLAGRCWRRLLLLSGAREPAAVGAAVVLAVLAALLSAARSLPAALDDLGPTLPGARDLRATAEL